MAYVKDSISFEISDYQNKGELPKDAWKVRPCECYKDEYKECKSIKARFHQYFIHGETLDCSQWKKDYDNCITFRNKKDIISLENVIESENKRCNERKLAAISNDVWEYRSAPPENWSSPMPEWMVKKQTNSLLNETQEMLDKGLQLAPVFSGFSCAIM